jgi:hypothetical protein
LIENVVGKSQIENHFSLNASIFYAFGNGTSRTKATNQQNNQHQPQESFENRNLIKPKVERENKKGRL